MKKVLSFILVIVISMTISACGRSWKIGNENPANSQGTVIEHTGKKIAGEIVAASAFSEGLAFVCVDDKDEKTYCINKDGYIVFELDFRAVDFMGRINSKFINGLAKIGEGICDIQGKITMPADVEVTGFCDIALEGGYIIVEKVTSDFEVSKKELGVMSPKFEWVVNLSEDIYNATGGISMIPDNTKCFYYDDYLYFENSHKYLHLTTGEIKDTLDYFPSKQWVNSDKCFYDYNNNEMLNLEPNTTINMPSGSGFVNGKSPVRFINKETNKYYFTVINETGEFLFDPVETVPFQDFVFDGEKVLVLDQSINPKTIICYDVEGKQLGQINTESVAKNKSFSCYISDDIILLSAGSNFKYTYCYYNCDFTQLF